MTNDELARAIASGVGVSIWALIFQKAKAYLSARRNETGRGLHERVAYRLGLLWSRGYRGIQQALNRSRV